MADAMAGLAYLSKTNGTGGEIAGAPEDFVVEEITREGKALSIDKTIKTVGAPGEYSVFALQKRGWSTQDAIKAMADRLGVLPGRFSAAGNKDRNAVTAQLISCWRIEPEQILEIEISGLKILGCWKSSKPMEVGDLLGNRFRIRITGVKDSRAAGRVIKETGGLFPNYFGPQRFGMRGNNHIVGKHIVRGDFQAAVEEFVENGEEESSDSRKARQAAKEDGMNEKTLELFPRKLNHERTVIRHLVRRPGDYIGAIGELPRNLQMILVQSYQSYLFNLMLSERIQSKTLDPERGVTGCGLNEYGFIDPETGGNEYALGRMIGYDTPLTETEEDVLWNEGIESANFRIRHLPALSMRGSARPLLSNMKDFRASARENRSVMLEFELPKGSYATVAVREISGRDKD
ncbi:putative tRNA pseudouridine synthase D [uncultured archaeon]|nr:putative tRNA pseudouridine synthase D [uncultured archaeon]